MEQEEEKEEEREEEEKRVVQTGEGKGEWTTSKLLKREMKRSRRRRQPYLSGKIIM